MKDEKLIKNQECIGCKKIFECPGKLRSTKACVNYEERPKDKNEEKWGYNPYQE